MNIPEGPVQRLLEQRQSIYRSKRVEDLLKKLTEEQLYSVLSWQLNTEWNCSTVSLLNKFSLRSEREIHCFHSTNPGIAPLSTLTPTPFVITCKSSRAPASSWVVDVDAASTSHLRLGLTLRPYLKRKRPLLTVQYVGEMKCVSLIRFITASAVVSSPEAIFTYHLMFGDSGDWTAAGDRALPGWCRGEERRKDGHNSRFWSEWLQQVQQGHWR